MSCAECPAAFVIHGASYHDDAVLCRVESTALGQLDDTQGPLSFVRERTSPAALHGYCLGDLQEWAAEIDLRGLIGTTEEQRRIAAAAIASRNEPSYRDCPSWRAEWNNRRVKKLVDLPGERRTYKPGNQGFVDPPPDVVSSAIA